ncbi:Uncharacterised protein [[Clostridium] sordellii]|uniref:hypothetical protein n=1 Tax=Paraclostridium sordellii TaxID=1505 RepID=UPI0005DFA883|nr:hypothetical protein [Paeniclostridium sordellii]CEN23726.1 Uncharacterised protein [[Clostridium] sordellii] [Paeniclostridium sordellii]
MKKNELNDKNRFTYEGDMLIKVGKKELYPFVYKRIWDLTQFDSIILKKYDLEKAIYVYIGSCSKYNLKHRCSQFRNDITNNKSNVAKPIREFIEKIKVFYNQETNYTVNEIDYLLYYNANVIARCESREGAYKLEKHLNSKYHYLDSFGEILQPCTILLSKVDSKLKEVKEYGIKILKVK